MGETERERGKNKKLKKSQAKLIFINKGGRPWGEKTYKEKDEDGVQERQSSFEGKKSNTVRIIKVLNTRNKLENLIFDSSGDDCLASSSIHFEIVVNVTFVQEGFFFHRNSRRVQAYIATGVIFAGL